MLKRKYEDEIQDWILNGKDALLISGARQIGKTYLIRECLKKNNADFIEINFIESIDYATIFEDISSSEDILLRLSLISKKELKPKETIIFFDEVQECPEIVTLIKFLVEEGSFKYIMSGSLLGVELKDLRSAPVGYMRILDMYPMDFEEFVLALGVQPETIKHLYDCYRLRVKVDSFIHEKMIDIFYLYLIIGGMPEALSCYIETNDLQKTKKIHNKIIQLYKQDFSKYEEKKKLQLREIYDSMASQLDDKNKRFKVSTIKEKARFNEFVEDFLWLKEAGVAIPIYNVNEPKEPLRLSENRKLMKLFYSDVGILTSFYSDATKVKILKKSKDINNGSLFENVVAQEFKAHGVASYFFNSKKQGEIDFVIELDGRVVPVEVKSGKDYKRHSALKNVISNEEYNIEEAIILSRENVQYEDKKLYLPIYMLLFIKNMELKETVYKLDLKGL